MSDLATNSVALGIAAFIACVVGTAAGWPMRALLPPSRPALLILVLAALVSSLGLWMGASAHGLRGSLGVFLPLLAVNLAIVWLGDNGQQRSLGEALRTSLMRGGLVLAVLVILGIARELVGRGSLFHGAANSLGNWAEPLELQLFPADMGFLLAMLPPGAFIALGLLLAARNWITNRHRHEPGQDR